jgi:predicted component of type VI protein secretion system
MTLTLTIQSGNRSGSGMPDELVLHRRGAVVGRAPTCDWTLPDPTRHVSSRHFEVRFDGQDYLLVDTSTNGTMLADTGNRVAGQHRITSGDRFQVGPYLIGARLTGDAAVTQAAADPPAWRGWDGGGAQSASSSGTADWAPAAPQGWEPAPAGPSADGWKPQAGPGLARPEPHRSGGNAAAASDDWAAGSGWSPSAAAPAPPVTSAWEQATPPPPPPSAWSSAAPDRPPPTSPDDLWGRIAEGNVVDWARGGFGQPEERPRDPLGLAPPPAASSLPAHRPPLPVPATPPPPHGPPPDPPTTDAFYRAAGADPARLGNPADAAERAGSLFRCLVAGLVVMVEARARAKAQLGAEATAFSLEGHNPLKFARTPEEAVTALLGPAQPGFMSPERAVEDAFQDLQSHQVATLRAMQGALRTTLERFSPAAIRARAEGGGLIERVLPAARDAALWQAYEREFGGVAQGSDEAFLDMFAKEFRQAYNEQSRRGPT